MLKQIILAGIAVYLLSACALTPEQQEVKRQKEAEDLRQLQISLAYQCNPQAAELIAKQKEVKQFGKDEEVTKFDQQYQKIVQNPVFQACYQMALKTYIQERRLEELERDYRRRSMMYEQHWMFPRVIYYPVPVKSNQK